MKPRRFEQHRSKSSMMCNRFSDFNVKSDKGKTPLIVLRCADNRQLFEGTGKGNGKAMKIKVTWKIQGMEFSAISDTVVSNLDRLGELEELGGKRHKFPAKGGTHSGRWCSGNLKAAVQDSVTANLEETKHDKKILIVSGERRGESAGRSKYNEMEIHRTNAEAKAHRIVHQWRCCIDYSEKDVWELLKRHHINPHPCYRIGWNRCSCMMCIFSTPRLFAGVKELFPDDYAALRHDEEVLGFTLDNKKNLDEFIGDTQSCVCWKDKAAIHSILTGEFNTDDIYTNDWNYPVGAFHGADGGSC